MHDYPDPLSLQAENSERTEQKCLWTNLLHSPGPLQKTRHMSVGLTILKLMCCAQRDFEQYDSILSAFASWKVEVGSKGKKRGKIRMTVKG